MSTLFLGTLATLVFCAPGYPGASADAQPFLDQFASAAVSAAGWPAGSLAAVYDPTEEGGLSKLGNSDAVLAFVPYPFFVEHAVQLHLSPLVQANVSGTGTQQRWTLVAKSGRVSGAASLSGFTIVSVAGYAPDFVRHSVLDGWTLTADVRIEQTGQILSALRKVAAGDNLVALLDQTQAGAIGTLPFAADLKPVFQSAPLPVALIAVVDSRLPAARARSLQAALLKMRREPGANDALASLRLDGFILPQLPVHTAGQ